MKFINGSTNKYSILCVYVYFTETTDLPVVESKHIGGHTRALLQSPFAANSHKSSTNYLETKAASFKEDLCCTRVEDRKDMVVCACLHGALNTIKVICTLVWKTKCSNKSMSC